MFSLLALQKTDFQNFSNGKNLGFFFKYVTLKHSPNTPSKFMVLCTQETHYHKKFCALITVKLSECHIIQMSEFLEFFLCEISNVFFWNEIEIVFDWCHIPLVVIMCRCSFLHRLQTSFLFECN